jgi:hypothetical protein
VPLSTDDRKKIEAVYLCGPKTADYLEMIGIENFAELAGMDAMELQLAINSHLGRPHINAMGVKALQNAIDAANAAIVPVCPSNQGNEN